MFTTHRLYAHSPAVILICLTASLSATNNAAHGQDGRVSQATVLIVDGQVKQVFQADGQVLVQLMVQRSEAVSIDATTRFPAPGELLYIHVYPNRSALGRPGDGAQNVPQVPVRIQAFLAVGQGGQWEADGRDWYRENRRDEPTAEMDDRGESSTLGIVSQPTGDGRDAGLKVVRVAPDSPAAKAGIEPGDLIVEANRESLRSQQQLDNAYRKSTGRCALTVRDVRSGRDVLVEVEATSASTSPTGREQSLGAATELAFLKGEPVVKVTAVTPGGPAQRAGITVGMLILKANNTPITSSEVLTDAVGNAHGRLTLQVVDPNDEERRERTIQVTL